MQYTSRSKWNRVNTVETSWVFPCGYLLHLWLGALRKQHLCSTGWCVPGFIGNKKGKQIKLPDQGCVNTQLLNQTSISNMSNYHNLSSTILQNHHFSTFISDFTNINQFHPNQQSCVPDPDTTAACNSRRTRSAPDCKASAAALP